MSKSPAAETQAVRQRRVRYASIGAALLTVALPRIVQAQLATIGAGLLVSDRPSAPVAELHAETPPIYAARAYLTLSWTDDSAQPTVITATEWPIVRGKSAITGLGAGLLWLEVNDYRPYPILVSSTVVPLPIPRTAVVGIAAVQPLQDFEWSAILKIGVTLWFVR